jgi:hypothetical protein
MATAPRPCTDTGRPFRSLAVRILAPFASAVLVAAAVGMASPALAQSSGLAGAGATGKGTALVEFGSRLYVAWQNGDAAIHMRDTADGKNWTDVNLPTDFRSSVGPAFAVHTSLEDHQARLYMAWKGDGEEHIWWSASTDGVHWPAKQQVLFHNGGNPGSSVGPALADYGGVLFMAWKGAGSDQRIWWSVLGGDRRWSQQIAVPGTPSSGAPSTSVGPALAAYTNLANQPLLYMAWKGQGQDQSIWYAYFDGQRWSAQTPVNGAMGVPPPGTSIGPALVARPGSLSMAWKGIDNQIGIFGASLAVSTWGPQGPVPGTGSQWTTAYRPALATFGSALWLAAVHPDGRLFVSKVPVDLQS